jgi:flagellar biosynthesis protein FlhA
VGQGPDQDLLGRVRALRRKIAFELGIVVPPVRARDDVDLPSATYAVLVAGVERGRGIAPAGKMLALGDDLASLPGTTVEEPVFGLPGKWVPAELRRAAEITGATVVDRVSVLITHLGAVIAENAPRLLGREEVRILTEALRGSNPSVVDELVPGLLSLGEVQRVLQGLLSEQVSIRDLGRLCEGIALRAKVSTDPEGLVEAARAALGPALADAYVEDATLRVVTLDPVLEQSLLESLRPSEFGTQVVLEPVRLEGLLASVRRLTASAELGGRPIVLACSAAIRPALRRLIALAMPRLAVLSYPEVTAAGVHIEGVGVVTDSYAISA